MTPQQSDTCSSKNDGLGVKDVEGGALVVISTGKSTSTKRSTRGKKFQRFRQNTFVKIVWKIVSYTPRRCRWDPDHPTPFSLELNVLFSFAAAFSVANLYYTHPILNVLAKDFNVTYERVSNIPTVMQAGYATGLILLCPLGDIARRRAFVLFLTCFTATMWLSLCLTSNFEAFAILSFLASVTTVTPQLILPLVADMAPPEKHASAIGLVVSGNLGGMLVARLLSGIITEYTSWRIVYWVSFAAQDIIVILLWLFMPDYPVTNPSGLNYFQMLWDMVIMLYNHPVLVQVCLVSFFISSTFTSFWTTLTFLLASPPYNYSSLIVGLLAIIGLGPMFVGPPYSRAIDSRFVPLCSTIVGQCMCLVGVLIGTYTGTSTIAGPMIEAFAIDIGMQTSHVSNRTSIYPLEPKARNRLNTVYMVFVFSDQLMGTAVGNRLYAQGGWISSGGANVGFMGAALIVCFARGPWHQGWIGWKGGWNCRRRDLLSFRNVGPGEEQVSAGVSEIRRLDENVLADVMQGNNPTTEFPALKA